MINCVDTTPTSIDHPLDEVVATLVAIGLFDAGLQKEIASKVYSSIPSEKLEAFKQKLVGEAIEFVNTL